MKRLNGVRLPHTKRIEEKPLTQFPLPELVRIPMLMHTGSPCKPTVQPGDSVKVGQCIGAAEKPDSVPVHASVSGTVKAITEYHTVSGETVPCIDIQPDGAQTRSEECVPPEINSKEDLIRAAKESGCVGLSGSGDLIFRKLEKAGKPDLLILNGAECEQYLAVDGRLMTESPSDIINGALLLMKLLKIKETRIGIRSDRPVAVKNMAQACEGQNGIKIIPLPPVYPQGAEKVLVFHTCGRVIPEKQTAADIGVLVLNVATCAFLYRYSQTGIPLVERAVTVAGTAVRKPCNLIVPVGTPVRDLLEYTACDEDIIGELLCGGTMMGEKIKLDEAVIVRQQNGLTALRRRRLAQRASDCIRCGSCMRACPMNLMPMELNRAFYRQDIRALQTGKLQLCMNCGCCSYVCPAKRPVADINQQAKKILPAD